MAECSGFEPASARTLVELLEERAERTLQRPAYTFLLDGEQKEHHISYEELSRAARALAVSLSERTYVGDRALVLMPPGPDFVVAFFASLYAGLMAVPAPMPQRKRGLPRLLSIVGDCRPSIILTTSEFGDALAQSGAEASLQEIAMLPWIAVDRLNAADAERWRMPDLGSDSLAFLQYTSGSTGSPKGVVLSHRNLLDNQRMIREAFARDEQAVVVGWLPPYHDMGLIGNILQPLYIGAPCVQMTPQHFLVRPWRWLAAISKYRGTTSGGPNFAFDLCVAKTTEEQRAALDLRSWKIAFSGAEPVRAATLERFARAFGVSGFRPQAFYPCYGLAEATLLVSGGAPGQGAVVKRFERAAMSNRRAVEGADTAASMALVGCGQARTGEQVVIVDPERRVRCESGQVGEIWVAGSSVARGYWQRDGETQTTFRAHLATGEGPFLRTGDLGFLLDGELFPTGRLKDLIIVRGRNLYPQDLEQTAEESHAQVRAGGTAAIAIESEDEERVVIVAEVDERDAPLDRVAEAVRSGVAERHEVAVHAIAFIKPGSLPRTTSGKVQRKATLARYVAGELELIWQPAATGDAEAEKTLEPFVEEVAAIWREALQCRSVGAQDRFLALGGDSLRAVQVSARVQARFGVEIPSVDLLESPSLGAFADSVRAAPAPVGAIDVSAQPVSRPSEAPLSFVQERIWLLEQLVSGSPVYHISAALRLRGELNIAALERAATVLVARHEALRTSFPVTPNGPVQRVLAAQEVRLPVRDVADADLRRLLVSEASRSFELSVAPPVRWLLARAAPGQHVLAFTCHHLIADGWSMGVILRELAALYTAYAGGEKPELPAVQRTYAEHALEQRTRSLTDWDTELSYWKQKLEAPPAPLEIFTDRSRPAVQTYAGARHEFVLGRDLTDRLQVLAGKTGATLFNIVAAGLFALLKRFTGQTELCLGAPVAGRLRVADEGVVGCFINTLALRVDAASGLTVEELAARTKEATLGAQAHQSLPFERLLQELPLERRLNQSPLFQVMIAMQPELPERISLPRLELDAELLHLGTAQFDLALDVALRARELHAAFEFNTDLFDAPTITRFADRLSLLLEQFASAPHERVDELILFASDDEEKLCRAPAEADEGPLTPVHVLFEQVAQRQPDRVAISDGARQLSYRELNERANQLGHYLHARGLRSGDRVGLYLERSIELVVAALAILKAGCAYVPIDPAQPWERALGVLEDSGVGLLLTEIARAEQSTGVGLPVCVLDLEAARLQREPTYGPECTLGSDAAAYVLYTSGSTGRPKGVLVQHRGLTRVQAAWRQVYELAAEPLRLLQLASPAFDVWTADWVRALCSGGTLIVAPREAALDPKTMWSWIEREQITVVDLVPAQVRALLPLWRERGPASSLELIVVGSDVWSVAEYCELRRSCPGVRILSCYGVTEATIDSTWFEGDALPGSGDSAVPLGRPFPGTRVYVVDASGQPLPVGLPGELAIGGDGVAAGYLNQPRLTAERFVPDALSGRRGARLYRTGDRARWNASGLLEFLGRVDHQVKVRGVRIEPREIEGRLNEHPAVRESAVSCRRASGGEATLVAYLVGDGTEFDATLREFLRQKLPEAMVPSAFVWLDRMPLNTNGKIDRLALPAPQPLIREASSAPQSELERRVTEVWCKVLGIGAVGRDDNFFDVGGHSLLLARVQAELAAALEREVPLLLLFQNPTIAAQARALDAVAAPRPATPERSTNDIHEAAERRSALRARRRREPETNG
jgi:amino acid adenylation domain-containing protein